jgi:hypothetical protein
MKANILDKRKYIRIETFDYFCMEIDIEENLKTAEGLVLNCLE